MMDQDEKDPVVLKEELKRMAGSQCRIALFAMLAGKSLPEAIWLAKSYPPIREE